MRAPVRSALIRIALNLVATPILVVVLTYFVFLMVSGVALLGLFVVALMGLLAALSRVWPAVAFSSIFVFGFLVQIAEDCRFDPGCDGSISYARTSYPGLTAFCILILLAGIGKGFVTDFRASQARSTTSSREAKSL